jgi:hypothetical protein
MDEGERTRTRSCYRAEELGVIAKLPAGDPRLAHLGECARCRALLALYRKSLDPGQLPPAARLDDARAVLSRRLEEGIRGTTLHLTTSGPAAHGFWQRLTEALRGPAMRPAWGAVVVVALIVVVWQVAQSPEETSSPPPLRGGGALESPVAAAPARLSNNHYLLTWTPVADAESYQVVLLLPGLDELTRLDAGGQTRLEVDLQTLPLPADPPTGLFWQVVALKSGNQIAASDMQTLGLGVRE